MPPIERGSSSRPGQIQAEQLRPGIPVPTTVLEKSIEKIVKEKSLSRYKNAQ